MLQHETRSDCETYNDYRRKANKTCRKKKIEMIKKQLETIEKLKSTNENRMFYRSVLQIKREYQPKLKACKDKQGKVIEDETEVIIRWAEHFEELLNKNDVNIERRSKNNKYLTAQPWIEYPTIEEVEDAILKLKK
jgi:hypothetical protein